MQPLSRASSLGWTSIVRLGLVQAALGAVVVMVTSTFNRVMVVEYALPASLPGALVALHYAVQMIRPRFGHGSDRGGRRTPWILGGMATLALGGVLCAVAVSLMGSARGLAVALAVAGYVLVGLGAGAAGTSLLVLLSSQVAASRRAAAATLMWVLMIAGFAVTSTAVGHFLDPFSPHRLIEASVSVALGACLLAFAAVWNVERRTEPDDLTAVRGRGRPAAADVGPAANVVASRSFRAALAGVWREPRARAFTLFVFVSMLAYSAQELLLEPFFGLVFGFTPGASARMAGLWHSGVLLGMICVGALCSGARRVGTLRAWTVGGCVASAVALLSLACGAVIGDRWPLTASVLALGGANGVFAVSAIGSMMELGAAGEGTGHEGTAGGSRNAGTRMGLWGAAQAIAFALGGLVGTGIVDLTRHYLGTPAQAFGCVFGIEALLFLLAAAVAARVGSLQSRGGALVTAVIA